MKRKLHLAMALTGNTKVTISHEVSVCMFLTVVTILLFCEAITDITDITRARYARQLVDLQFLPVTINLTVRFSFWTSPHQAWTPRPGEACGTSCSL